MGPYRFTVSRNFSRELEFDQPRIKLCHIIFYATLIHLLKIYFQVKYRVSQKFVPLLYIYISLYFRTIGLGKQIISTKVVSFNIIHYYNTGCAIFWLEYLICVLLRQRCVCGSVFSSHTIFVFHSPNRSISFLVFCEYHER